MKSIEELNEIREKTFKEISLRKDINYPGNEKHILVCGGTGCTSSHSGKIIEKLNEQIKEKNIENVRVVRTGCFGLCARGPIMVIRPEDTFYAMATEDDVEEQKEDIKRRFGLENERYFNLYGVQKEDKSNYDFVIDTTNISQEEVAKRIIVAFEKWLEE